MQKLVGLCVLVLTLITSLTANTIVSATDNSSVVISEVLTGNSQSASAEFVELHNQMSSDVAIEGWKIQYLSANGASISVRATLHGLLRANGSMFAATAEYGTAGDEILNAGMPETGGRLRLVNSTGTIIDSLSWGAGALGSEGAPALPPIRGQSIVRIIESDTFRDTNDNAADFTLVDNPIANGGGVIELADMCPNEDIFPGIQDAVPVNYVVNEQGNCVPIPVDYARIVLNEILPDPASPKTDANDEFIELYNPTDNAVDVSGYKLLSGVNLTATYVLSPSIIPAHGYLLLYSSQTKISLPNNGSKLQLVAPDGSPMGDILEYGPVGTNQVWAYFSDGWKLSDQLTPGKTNELVITNEGGGDDGSAETAVAPCPAGKYRHPLTNRCRNIETDANALASCDGDEYRSPETNRCRKFTLASATITPCQTGYERNAETNRCRKVAGVVSTLKPCDPGQERSPQTNRCRKATSQKSAASSIQPNTTGFNIAGGIALGVVGLSAIGYGVYEWRSEIAGAFGRLIAALGKK